MEFIVARVIYVASHENWLLRGKGFTGPGQSLTAGSGPTLSIKPDLKDVANTDNRYVFTILGVLDLQNSAALAYSQACTV